MARSEPSPNQKQTKDIILELVRLIDRNKNRTFRPLDAFHSLNIVFVALSYVLILVWFFVTFSSESLGIKLSISLSFLALTVGIFSLFAPSMEENVVDVNFKRLEKCVEKDEKPLLKALIQIKVKNKEFDLEQICNMNGDMFTKEKLLETLYE